MLDSYLLAIRQHVIDGNFAIAKSILEKAIHERKNPAPTKSNDILLVELNLDTMTQNALEKAGLETIGDVRSMEHEELHRRLYYCGSLRVQRLFERIHEVSGGN